MKVEKTRIHFLKRSFPCRRRPQTETSQSNLGSDTYIHRLLLGVTVHEFMLISMCQCLCHIMIVSWSHGFMCFVVSMDTWFRGVYGFIVSCVSWFHRFRGVNGFMVS